MEIRILHFDSISSVYETRTNTTSSSTYNPYSTKYTLNSPIKSVRQLRLKSIELPLTLCNIRTGSTNTLSLRVNSTTYTITISEQLITSIDTLISVVNAAVLAAIPAYSIVFSLPTDTYKLQLVTNVSITIYETNLIHYIMGFTTSTSTGTTVSSGTLVKTVSSGSTTTADGSYNLTVDNYLNFIITNLPGSTSTASGIPCTFKIPLNSGYNSIYYWADNISSTQWIDTGIDFDLSSLSVQIKDRFNNDINPNGGDYSFTLQISSVAI
jgi:hypothetical protein